MRKEEQWTMWKPLQDLSRKYYIDFIINGQNGFNIVLVNAEHKKIHITFQNSVKSYRYIDESYVQKTLTNLNNTHGKSFYADWSFFKITNSGYLKTLSEESEGLSDHTNFIHFCFLLEDAMLDVIADYEPTVECT